jgi:SRSO17 transposase
LPSTPETVIRTVLVVDETGDLKKGAMTVGVQRQYTGTAGRVENAQVAVYLAYAGARGHAMIDRELYLPTSWTGDDQRRAAAGVPQDIDFMTKPALAAGMICRALDAGVPARWVAGDEVYGADPVLRRELELRRVGYALAIGCNRRVTTPAGAIRADALTARLPRHAWQQLSARAGAKGERYYDWALITLTPPETTSCDTSRWWLLVRRHRYTGELAFYRCYSPQPVPLRKLVGVAGRRWTVEESFQAGKGLAGLDEHQVRNWTSWRRWTLLAMAAHALLAVIAANEHANRPAPAGLIALTCNEIRKLFTILVIEPCRTVPYPKTWSDWRRRHQYRAHTSHYQRQSIADGGP